MKQKNLILMVVAIGCGLVAAFLTTQINAKPKVENIEIWVAAKDLPVGTMMSRNSLDKLIVKKSVPKDSVPPTVVTDENDLVDKRLNESVAADRWFDPAKLSTGGVIVLPEGKDMVSLAMSVGNSAAGFIGPGSKVDVLATVKLGTSFKAFPLMVDMLVLAVNQATSYDASKMGTFPNMSMVSFAVTQEQALLLAIAKQRGCHLELLLRHPNKPVDPTYDIKKMRKLLEDDMGKLIVLTTEGTREDKTTPAPGDPNTPMPSVAPPVAPEPSLKAEMLKVLVATADIPPKTEITKDLIAQKFKEVALPKDLGEGACTDLTPFLGEFLKNGVSKGQWVTPGMIGQQETKPPPPEEFHPKPEPKPEPVKPEPVAPTVTGKQIWDVAVHTASGTMIYRYEKLETGEWKFKRAMSPEEAGRDSKQQPATPQTPPATPDKSPDVGGRKID